MTKNFGSLFESLFLCFDYFKSTLLFLLTFLHISVLLRRHGDIELNPGPRKSKVNTVSVCHWNLNSITAHNFSKLTQLKAYISTYKYDFICLPETFLDSSIPDNLVDIQGYNLVRADHRDNTKRGGVCIYYKESLPVRVINLPYFKEALLLEMRFNRKKVIVSVIYRSPSQNSNQFELSLSKLENLLSDISKRKQSLSVVTGDFNARSSSWWCNDINIIEGSHLYPLTSSNCFSQLINEPTHIQTNSSSCIDLIFTNQPNSFVNSGVHSSLHPNCHHQIVHTSFNLDIYYPPPYQRLIWDYKKADSTNIRKTLDSVIWERLFDKKDFNSQFVTLNETILNALRNYVPNMYISIDDKNAVWMNEIIKSNMETKNKLYQQYIQNRRFESDLVFIESLIAELNYLISYTKDLYYENLAKKLNNPLLQAKTYWSILKLFYNDRKVPLIPPLLIDDNLSLTYRQKQTFLTSFLLTNVNH